MRTTVSEFSFSHHPPVDTATIFLIATPHETGPECALPGSPPPGPSGRKPVDRVLHVARQRDVDRGGKDKDVSPLEPQEEILHVVLVPALPRMLEPAPHLAAVAGLI